MRPQQSDRVIPAHGIEVELVTVGDAVVVSLTGDLDIASSPRVGVALREQLRRRPRCVVVDLNGVGFVDSTGFSVLLNARRGAVRDGVPLRLACDVGSTLKLLALLRLDRDFDVHPTRAAALAACGD